MSSIVAQKGSEWQRAVRWQRQVLGSGTARRCPPAPLAEHAVKRSSPTCLGL